MNNHLFGHLRTLVVVGIVTSAIFATIAIAAASDWRKPQSDGPPDVPAGQLKLGDEPAFPVSAYSWGVSAESSWTKGGGASVGKPNPDAISFTKAIDQTSIAALKNIASGVAFPSAVFTATLGGGAKMVYELASLYVTRVSQSGAGGPPAETITFVFKEVKWTYTSSSGNSTSGTWDIPAGTVT